MKAGYPLCLRLVSLLETMAGCHCAAEGALPAIRQRNMPRSESAIGSVENVSGTRWQHHGSYGALHMAAKQESIGRRATHTLQEDAGVGTDGEPSLKGYTPVRLFFASNG